ncbi:hypothetical protein S83_016920 [Arachis hypogaea]
MAVSWSLQTAVCAKVSCSKVEEKKVMQELNKSGRQSLAMEIKAYHSRFYSHSDSRISVDIYLYSLLLKIQIIKLGRSILVHNEK